MQFAAIVRSHQVVCGPTFWRCQQVFAKSINIDRFAFLPIPGYFVCNSAFSEIYPYKYLFEGST